MKYLYGNYRFENCGERYPLAVEDGLPDIIVGGVHCPLFSGHGPGCAWQVFSRIEE